MNLQHNAKYNRVVIVFDDERCINIEDAVIWTYSPKTLFVVQDGKNIAAARIPTDEILYSAETESDGKKTLTITWDR